MSVAARPRLKRSASAGRVRDGRAVGQIVLLRLDDEVLDIMMTWDQLSEACVPPPQEGAATDWRQ